MYLKKIKKDLWNFLEKYDDVMPYQNQFTSFFPGDYGPNKLLNVRSHKLLPGMSSLEEENLNDDVLSEGDIGDEEKTFPEKFCDSDNSNDIKIQKEEF